MNKSGSNNGNNPIVVNGYYKVVSTAAWVIEFLPDPADDWPRLLLAIPSPVAAKIMTTLRQYSNERKGLT